ncbi:hypothetical protein [Neorhizobium sp. DT-125]|uniref:hypothetical protein n=1 Tax=Neorhizobium sp. DT-125 TaxID=3396163 RepID=UPI003F1C9096
MEVRAYQDAWPHPGAALACAEPRSAKLAAAAAAQIERRIFFKVVVPVVCPCTLRAKTAKQGEKWRKSGVFDHGTLQAVTFVIKLLAIFLRSQLNCDRRKHLKTAGKRNGIPA